MCKHVQGKVRKRRWKNKERNILDLQAAQVGNIISDKETQPNVLLLLNLFSQLSLFSEVSFLPLPLPTRKYPALCMPHNWQRLLFIINYSLSISTHINISNTTNRNIKSLVTSASYTSSQSTTNHMLSSTSMFESVLQWNVLVSVVPNSQMSLAEGKHKTWLQEKRREAV